MSPISTLQPDIIELIGETCVCLRIQRASRTVGRQFDEVFRPLGLNNWQFSLLISLKQSQPPTVNELAEELGMDRTTTTKNLRPLERRRLLRICRDKEDGRVRRIVLTNTGEKLLVSAVEHWQIANDAVSSKFKKQEFAELRSSLDRISET
jgi:DNA-binding MarR family transcriptional regulator